MHEKENPKKRKKSKWGLSFLIFLGFYQYVWINLNWEGVNSVLNESCKLHVNNGGSF